MIFFKNRWRPGNIAAPRELFALFLADRRGVTMLEYALIAALTMMLATTAIVTIGTNVESVFKHVASTLQPTANANLLGGGAPRPAVKPHK